MLYQTPLWPLSELVMVKDTGAYSLESNWQQTIIGSLNRRRAIVWTSDGIGY